MMPPKPDCISVRAEELCKRFPKTATRTLATKLRAEFPGAVTLEMARSRVRAARGTVGKGNGAIQKVPWEKKQAGWVAECPPSIAEPWEPFILSTPCRVLSLSDLHVPYHSKGAIEAAVEYGKGLRPTVLLLNGDIGDFYSQSKYDKNPSRMKSTADIDCLKEVLSWLRGQFPRCKIIYKMGNHDQRWDHWIWAKAPLLWDMDQVQLHNILEFEKLRITRVDDNPVMAGRLPILHGHEVGRGISSPVNPARGLFLRTNHTALVGHHHRPSSHPEPDMFQSETVTWTQGCLCDLRPEYARFNKWAWGFAFIEVEKNGEFEFHNFKISKRFVVRNV
jgi:predicted phosphodiesterase